MFEAWRKRRIERRAQKNAQKKLDWFIREIVRAIKAGELRPNLSRVNDPASANDRNFEFSFRNVRVSGRACRVSDDIFGGMTYCSSLTLDGSEVHTFTDNSLVALAIIGHQERLEEEAESQSKIRFYHTLQNIAAHLPESRGNGKKAGELSLADDRVGAVSLPE